MSDLSDFSDGEKEDSAREHFDGENGDGEDEQKGERCSPIIVADDTGAEIL